AFKQVILHSKAWKDQGVDSELCMIGAKGAAFFRSVGGNIVASVRDIGEQPTITNLIGSVKVMLDGFVKGNIDKLFLVYNEFVNTMTQVPTIEQLLPLKPAEGEMFKRHAWDYLYEPEASELL